MWTEVFRLLGKPDPHGQFGWFAHYTEDYRRFRNLAKRATKNFDE